ncbi:MAG: hypothetical protein KFF49_07510, partial [Bacteroidales bacterium]|nr:hypothetical protein [Bacteroidales bacterium]
MKNLLKYFLLSIGLLILAPACNFDSNVKKLKDSDYRKAEKMLTAHTSRFVFRADVRPQWIDHDHFWYLNSIPEGNEYILVDAEAMERKRAFDHEELSGLLSEELGKDFKEHDL